MSQAQFAPPFTPGPERRPAEPHEEEARLRVLVAECVASGVARRVLLLRLASLPREDAPSNRLHQAGLALEPLAQADRGRLFRLPGGNLAAVWRGEATAALQASLTALIRLFDASGTDPGPLLRLFDLPDEAGALLEAIGRDAPPTEEPSAETPEAPLDPPLLASLEAALVRADISSFLRRRPVCARRLEGGFRQCWEMRSLAVTDLAAALIPARSVRADPWLFRRLTRTLDRRMLALLAVPQELRHAPPFGIALNVAAILGPEFLHFDALLPEALRGRVVLGLRPADALAEPETFLFARDFAHARGYRLMLRGMTPELLELVPPERIGLDLVALRYSAALARRTDALPFADPDAVVLTRADTPEALSWGRAQGIALYQGRAVRPGGGEALPESLRGESSRGESLRAGAPLGR